jgi:hypothetical protein
MSLLKTNEIQNYNGSSLTLTASTVSTSAQLNTGGNISVTGSLNVSDDSTTRTNLGLGTIATQDSSNVNLTGGTIGSGVVTDTKTIQTFNSTSVTAITASGFGTTTNYDKGFSVASDFASITEGSGITTSTPSSGVVTKFLFPTVGKYLISFTYLLTNNDTTSSQVRQFQLKGVFSNDNGATYTDPNNIISDVKVNIERLDNNTAVTGTSIPFLFSVTDTSNDVFGFQYRFFSASNDFEFSSIGVTFIRI